MLDYLLKSEFIHASELYYVIEAREKDGSTLLLQQQQDMNQAEIEFKKTLKKYRDSAHCIVLYLGVAFLCSTKKNVQLAEKDLKKINPNFKTVAISYLGPKVRSYNVSIIRAVRSYYPKINKEFFAPDYWRLYKPNK